MAFGQVLKARESKSSQTTESNLQNFRGKKLLPVFCPNESKLKWRRSNICTHASCTKFIIQELFYEPEQFLDKKSYNAYLQCS